MPAFLITTVLTAGAAFAQTPDLDRAPINYTKGAADNSVARLNERLAKREVKLAHDEELGYLSAVLDALGISKKSQCLVFSKTSLQQRVISPRTPRAIYFNDDVYVGYCRNGEVLEVSTADPNLGTVFYTLYQESQRPKFARQHDNCLQCHGSTATQGYPGHLVRSLRVDSGGYPHFSAGTFRTDMTSPFSERWGGWYVTGTHGAARHMGNLVFTKDEADADGLPSDAGQNVTDLKNRFDASKYLSPHSDIVALMVLEHQTDMHNRLCRASIDARLALDEQKNLNKELGEKPDHAWDSINSRLNRDAEEIVEGLLFKSEPILAAPVKGTSGFAEEFVARTPKDKSGRSLRELDLKTRLLRYPCSYLIYSPSFRALPPTLRSLVRKRLLTLLTTPKIPAGFESLAASDRGAILAILRDTVPNL